MSYYFGYFLLFAVLATGFYTLLNKLYLLPRRKARLNDQILAWRDAGNTSDEINGMAKRYLKGSWITDLMVSFFPILFIVFFVRAFVVEPFRIPSGSMLPTLQNGDMILVNKFVYGIRLPLVNQKIIETGSPKRGDVVVFRYPDNVKEDYIKRIVGLPGDVVSYTNKVLTINGQVAEQSVIGPYLNLEQVPYSNIRVEEFSEQLPDLKHNILKYTNVLDVYYHNQFKGIENCEYTEVSFTCTVPQNSYFAMGDNRDDSKDSRFWGFVPEENLVGKAFFIWLNLKGYFSRLGWI